MLWYRVSPARITPSSQYARLAAGSGLDRPAPDAFRGKPVFHESALTKKSSSGPCRLPAIAAFAQEYGTGSKSGNFWKYSGFGIRFQIISMLNIFPAIDHGKIYWRKGWIMFKWLTVLYVDPQNLMTN
jgi:hypothetical protein